MKRRFVYFAILAPILLALGCGKKEERAEKPEPTYKNISISQWARQCLDQDRETRDRAIIALAEFDISSGQGRIEKILEPAIQSPEATKDMSDAERGALIGLAQWLTRRAPKTEEIPLLFAAVKERTDIFDPWWHVASFAEMALRGMRSESDQKKIAETARELMESGVAVDRMKNILRDQEAPTPNP